MTQKVPQALVEITGPLPTGNEVLGRVVVEEMPAARIAQPLVYNVTCTVADTEYHQDLPANCRLIELQVRTDVILRFAFVTGKVATPTAPYLTLKSNSSYCSPPDASPVTLFVASSIAGTIVEIIAWA